MREAVLNTRPVGEVLESLASDNKLDFFGFCPVVDQNNELFGITTLKDLTKALLNNEDVLDAPVKDYCNTDFIFGVLQGGSIVNIDEIINKIANRHYVGNSVQFLPLVDEQNCFVRTEAFSEAIPVSKRFNVSVHGLGFVGLTLLAALATKGFKCIGVDNNKNKIKQIKGRVIPVLEKGIDEIFSNYQLYDNVFTTSHSTQASNVKVICVGTDINKDLNVNFDPLINVLLDICKDLKKGDLVILRSTVPVGTTRDIVNSVIQENSNFIVGQDVFVAFCPERTVEGNAIQEISDLPQIIGGFSRNCASMAEEFFSVVCETSVIAESLEAAELCKLLNNSYRDLSFAFANEVIELADRYNIDAANLIACANQKYPRNTIPSPSPGVGGYCLTKDPYIYASGFENRSETLSSLGRKINDKALQYPLIKFREHVLSHKMNLADLTVGIVGVAFKGRPKTNDTRGSSGLFVADQLKPLCKEIMVFDEVFHPGQLVDGFKISSEEVFLSSCDAIFILNNNVDNIQLDWSFLKNKGKEFFVFDGWFNLADKIPAALLERITYSQLGKIT